jgi:citrate synthase
MALPPPATEPMLTTDDVAHRLGVKPATVYAYVSRGLLKSRRNAEGKGSLFARADVDAFVAGRKRTTTPAVQTGITLIQYGSLFYRGHEATRLAFTTRFESVVNLLWTGDLVDVALDPAPELLAVARPTVAALPAAARTTDYLRVIVAASAAADPLRFDTARTAVAATGRALLATMVEALPSGVVPVTPASLAEALWHRLSLAQPSGPDLRLLNACLILLADHDIAASTLAARVAASTRAHPYAVVGAGLAALDGPLHGAASGLAHGMLAEAVTRNDPVATIAGYLRTGEPVPGFGHNLYPDGDPRATALLAELPGGRVRDITGRIIETMLRRSGVHPNVDLALAAFTLQHGMPEHAGEAIFAVARTAGWIAHALEEYEARPLRFRFSAQYAGHPITAG